MALVGVAAALEQVEALPDPLEQLLGAEQLDAGGGELDRERQAVEAADQLVYGRRVADVGRIACARSRNSLTASVSPIGGRSNSASPAIRSGSRLVATKPERRGGREQLRERPRAIDGSSCSRLSRTTWACLSPRRVAIAAALSPEAPRRAAIERHDERGVADRSERHEDGAAVGLVGEEPCQLDREPGLARAARADDREHARIALEPQRGGLEELALAPEKAGRRGGEVDRARRAERRELRVPSWNSCAGASKSLSRWRPRSRSGSIVDERGGRGREDHLAAVRERGDARAAVDVDSDIALGGHVGVPVWSPMRTVIGPGASASCPATRPRRRPSRSGTRRRTRRPACRPRRRRSAANASRRTRRCSASASA